MAKFLAGRVVVVTGGGSGIGRAIALRLAARGASLALLGRRAAPLDAVAEQARALAAGGTHLALPADVCERAAVDEAFARAAGELGALHAVVANAGIGGPNAPGAGDRWDEIVRANLDGCYWSFRAFERQLAGGDDWKHALAISSCVARFGVPGLSAYSAAKAGQLGLVRSLALELAPKRVLVNAVCPGWVDTEMAQARFAELAAESGTSLATARAEMTAAVPLARISEPEEIAALVEFLLGPGGAPFSGQTFDPNNGAWMG